MTRRRRLFFALWPDDSVRQALLHWQTHNLPSDVRWQHRADLHMTLEFLGMVDEGRVDELIAVGDRLAVGPFGLVLDELGHWTRPQVLWCAPSSLPGELTQLYEDLAVALEGLGFARDARPFRPHVTLARKVRKLPPHGPLSPVSWSVAEWALVESVPGSVPLYAPIRRWSLTDGS